MPYIGRGTSDDAIRSRFVYVASGSETSISGADANGAVLKFTDGAYVDVYLNGVLLKPTTDYNTNTANTIAGLAALSASDEVLIVVYDTFNIANTVDSFDGGTFQGKVTFENKIDMNGTELILDADADSSITADTDDQIDIRIAGADDFAFKANKFEVQSGSNIDMNGNELILDADADTSITADTDDFIDFKVGGTDTVSIGGANSGMDVKSSLGLRVINGSETVWSVVPGNDGNTTFLTNRTDGTASHGSYTWNTRNGGTTVQRFSIDSDGFFQFGVDGTNTFSNHYGTGGFRVTHHTNGFYNTQTYDGLSSNGHLYYTSSGDSGGYDNIFYTGSTQTGMLDPTYARFIGATTSTSNSANCQVDGNGRLHTSTSSKIYKTAIEDLTDDYADKIFQLEPKFYKANTDKVGDDLAKYKPDWSFYGLIAEDVEKVEPRLVQYKVAKLKDKENYRDADEFEELETPEPMTVNYSTLTVHLINIVKRFKTRIETLEAKVKALEDG